MGSKQALCSNIETLLALSDMHGLEDAAAAVAIVGVW